MRLITPWTGGEGGGGVRTVLLARPARPRLPATGCSLQAPGPSTAAASQPETDSKPEPEPHPAPGALRSVAP